MFYAQFVLSKKGPLAKIWLAAHWEKKLSKAQIYETNVQDAVAEIMQPKVKLSLRTTGHLLLGIVRIYSKKAQYVMADCNDAFLKLKMAFKPGTTREIEIREREQRDGNNDVPEVITDFYDNLPEINDFELGPIKEYQANQSRIDDITLREDRFETSSHMGLDFVADPGAGGLDDFGEKEHLRRSRSRSIFEEMEEEVEQQRRDPRGSGQLSFQEPREIMARGDVFQKEGGGEGLELFDHDFNDFGTADDLDMLFNVDDLSRELDLGGNAAATPLAPGANEELESMEVDGEQMEGAGVAAKMPSNELSFQLEPIEQQQRERVRQKQRKRKLIIDEQKNISGDEMKANMADYSDTIQPLDLAPPTKQLMRLKENSQLEKILTMPACMDWLLDPQVIKFYQSHLVLHACDASDMALTEELHNDLQLADNIDEELYNNNPDIRITNSPSAIGPIDFNGTAQENELPPPDTPVNEQINITPAFSPPTEKRSTVRRSRVHERDEEDEDEELFTRRTKNILQSIATKLRLSETNKIDFEDLFTKGSTRRTAAQKFYALLELKKWQAIEVEQQEAFGQIQISAGPRMQEP